MSLSSAEVSLCCWGAGEKTKRQRAGNNAKMEERREAFSRLSPLPIVPRALSIFSVIAIFIGIPSRNLCGGESWNADRVHSCCALWKRGFLDQATSSCHFRVGSREPTFLAANQWRSFGVSLISVGEPRRRLMAEGRSSLVALLLLLLLVHLLWCFRSCHLKSFVAVWVN